MEISMAESNMSGIPGVGAMTDTLEFVKNLWGGMKIPGMAMPSLSVDEVNKQITDLKAVESWLNVNMSMLRSTIQALEVQSATLAALQTMSASMSSLTQASMPPAAAPKPAPGAAAPRSAPSAPSAPATPSASSFTFDPPVANKPGTPGGAPAGPQAGTPSGAQAAGAELPNAAFANPAAWWNLLQDQFKQAVSTAVASEPAAPQKAAPEATKPRAKKTAAPARKSARKT
jgi:hypothetical protein